MDDTKKNDSGNVQRDVVYYYSREHRLQNASPEVCDLNDGKPIRPSLSKTLFATRPHRIVFFILIFFITVSVLVSRFTRDLSDNGLKLGGNSLAFSLVPVDGMLILEIVKTMPKSGQLYIGPVDITVSPVPARQNASVEQSLFKHLIFFNTTESETYHIVLPYSGEDFLVVLNAGEEQKSLRLKTGGS